MSRDYHDRLALMEGWYRHVLSAGPAAAAEQLIRKYEPHREFLAALTGRVIHIGGGAGLARRYLHSDVDYVVVDPAEIWRSSEWMSLAERFRSSGPQPKFFAAAGEDLPFGDGEFDGALAFWSLNHTLDPARCVEEMMRVLKQNGVARLVLEDMEPSWRDLIADCGPRVRSRLGATPCPAKIHKPMREAVRAKLTGNWPIQDDHIRVSESDLLCWVGDAVTVRRRAWIDGYLTYDLVKGGLAGQPRVSSRSGTASAGRRASGG